MIKNLNAILSLFGYIKIDKEGIDTVFSVPFDVMQSKKINNVFIYRNFYIVMRLNYISSNPDAFILHQNMVYIITLQNRLNKVRNPERVILVYEEQEKLESSFNSRKIFKIKEEKLIGLEPGEYYVNLYIFYKIKAQADNEISTCHVPYYVYDGKRIESELQSRCELKII